MFEKRIFNQSFRIVLAYLLAGCLWIAFSDEMLALISNRQTLINLSIIKGILFVFITAAILYYLINSCIKHLESSERALAVSEERLRMALVASQMGVWEWDQRTDHVIWSPEIYDIVGLKDFDGRFESFARLLHPEDAERVMAAVRRTLKERVQYADEFRIVLPESGEIRWLANLGQGRYATDGTPLILLGTVRDITKQKTAQEALRVSEERLKLLLQGVKIGIWDWDLKSGLAYLSPEYYEIAEYRAEDVVPDLDFFKLLVHPDDWDHVIGTMNEHLRGERADSNVDFRIITGAGTVKWIISRGKVVERDQTGAPSRVVGTMIDNTAHKQTDEALRESNEHLQRFYKYGLVGVMFWNFDGLVIDANDRFLEMIGHTREELVSGNIDWIKLTPPEFSYVDKEFIKELQAAGTNKHQYEKEFVCKNGIRIPVLISAVLLESGHVDGIAYILDITERKKAEKAQLELIDNLHSLTEHIQTVQEMERLAIARNIHDEIGQRLTALKLDISWLRHRLTTAEIEQDERLNEMESSVDLLISSIQRTTAELRPPLLDNLGLAAAIGWQVNDFTRRSGIECIMMLNEDAEPEDPQTATSIIRIVQESLTNIIRHAGASEVNISLCKTNDDILLEISDNGRGITEGEITASDSYGLIGMRERARLCHGLLSIAGLPGGGTLLRLTIPYRKGTTKT